MTLRKIVNKRWNPFTEASAATVITDEVHAVSDASPYWARLNEVPDEDYTEPTSGTPVYIRNTDATVFTEVGGSPGLNEFRVDYDYKSGWVEFNSGNADDIILVCYRGLGSPVEAELINALQWFETAAPYFGGDGSDGDVHITANTNLSADPAGSYVAFKQYTNLEVDGSKTVGLSGIRGMILNVQGLLKLGDSAVLDVTGDGAAAGAMGAFGGGGGGGGDAAGDDGGGPDKSGSTASQLFLPGAGAGGAGGGALTAGSAGTNYCYAQQDIYWRSLANMMVYGAGGGAGGSAGGAGGAGAGFIIINCGVLEVGASVSFSAGGSNGAAAGGGGNKGGGGGGAGGCILILANRIVGETAANVQANMCDVGGGTGGAGAIGGKAGGAGADGVKRVIEIYDYNVY